MQAQGATDDAVITPGQAPRSAAEREERTAAAARLAAALGMQLVMVRDDPVLKVPAHLEVRQAGYCYAAGALESIEPRLEIDRKQRAARDRAVAMAEAAAAKRARIQAEAVAASPAAQLAALKAEVAALRAERPVMENA
jgi:hypothetical protein